MTDHATGPLEPDPRLGAALRALGEPPLEEVDWEGLRERARRGAELPLAARQRAARAPAPRPWARRLLPAAAAASLALGVWLGAASDRAPGTAPAVAVDEAEAVLRADLSDQEFRSLVSGRAEAESLLLLAAEME